ncbi:MAG TPA: hypothetical protein VJ728_10130 [Candidatus Binataceae bacterium]|nr:hypothetical protein [Candidatus Binataceae bacterium]
MIAKRPVVTSLTGIILACVLAIGAGGCTSLDFNTARNPNLKKEVAGVASGTLLGAAGGALVGAALIGAPGMGAGVGALIGAGSGWAVAKASEAEHNRYPDTEAQLEHEQREIDATRRELDHTRQQLNQQAENENHNNTYDHNPNANQ